MKVFETLMKVKQFGTFVDDLLKARATIGTIHRWKSGYYQKVSMTPSKWMPVKKDKNGKWVKDDSREGMEEDQNKDSHLQDHEVREPKGRDSSAVPGAKTPKRGRKKKEDFVVQETRSEGKIVRVDGKKFRYSGPTSKGDKISESEIEKFRAKIKRREELRAKREEKKAKPESEQAETETPKKSTRGRKSDPIGTIKVRQGGQKWAKVSDGQGTKDWKKYDGPKEVGDKLDDSEIEKLKAVPTGKRGRPKDPVGKIIQRKHGKVMKVGERQEITYHGDLDVGEIAPKETIDAYKADYQEKQAVKGYRQNLLSGFEPRKREFTNPHRRKAITKNPFQPPDMKPNRGEVTDSDRQLKKLGDTLAYTDSGVQVVKGTRDHLTSTNYMSEDIRATLYSHQVDFVNQTMEAFAERKKKTTLNLDGTGAGKTMQQLALAETFIENNYNDRTMKPIFIVTQNDRIINDAFLEDANHLKIRCTVPENADEVRPGINLITYSSLHKFYDEAKDTDLIVFDEAHNMKGVDTRTGELGRKLNREVRHSALFTATPLDKPEHLMYVANALNLDENKLLEEFGYTFTPPKPGKDKGTWNFNKKLTDQQVIDNIARINQLFQLLENEGLVMRREKSLSGLRFSHLNVPIDEKAAKEMEASYIHARDIEIAAGAELGIPAYAFGGKWIQKRRSALENLKIPAALDAIEKEIKEGRSVVFFATRASESVVRVVEGDETQQKIANLTTDGKVIRTEIDEETGNPVKVYKQTASTIKAIEDGLKERGITFETLASSDEDSKNKRKAQQKIKRFQDGKAQVFITTPQSGGTGVNLDDQKGDSPRTAIIMTPPFSANDEMQMLGRIHRLSTKSKTRALMLMTNTATDEWNGTICDNKIERLGAAVGGDVAKNMNPELVKALAGLSDEKAADLLSRYETDPDQFQLKASDAVKEFKSEDYLSAANQMTGRTFGMNDIDILKEYVMFNAPRGEVDTTSEYARPGFRPDEKLPLAIDTRANYTLPFNRSSKVGRIVASHNPDHPEVPKFYVVVGRDNKHAYAKPVADRVSNEQALQAMVERRYGFLGREAQNDFFERIKADAGSEAVPVQKSVSNRRIPKYNGMSEMAAPSISPLSDQLLLSLIGTGGMDAAEKLLSRNLGEFLDNVR